MSARELATRLKVEPSVAQRDLKALQTAGLRISRTKENGEWRYRWEGPPELQPLQPDEDEWVSLFLAAADLRARGFVRQGKALAAVADRAVAPVPASAGQEPSSSPGPPPTKTGGPAVREEIIQPILRASSDHRALRVHYRSVREQQAKPRELYPELVFHDGATTQLIARGPDFDDPRIFVVQRIEGLEETGRSFAPIQRFRVEDFLRGAYRVVRGDAVQRIRIRFKPELEPELRDFEWPAETGVERMASGYLRVTAMMTVLPELERWLATFEDRIQVLEPQFLQQAHQNRRQPSATAHFSSASLDRPLE